MTIFQLLLYSCVVTTGLAGELMSKVCEWRPAGFYRVEGKCGVEGSQQHGKPVFEFNSTCQIEKSKTTSACQSRLTESITPRRRSLKHCKYQQGQQDHMEGGVVKKSHDPYTPGIRGSYRDGLLWCAAS